MAVEVTRADAFPVTVMEPDGLPAGFVDRVDGSDDSLFYALPRFVTHIDDDAIVEVGGLYRDLGLAAGHVLDLMSSWVSHFLDKPRRLTVLGMNRAELDANEMANERIVSDLNADPIIPMATASIDHAVCCVSVDYLTKPIDVFREVARVLVPGGLFVCTFSNRLFPTKAVRGWMAAGAEGRCRIVAAYFRRSGAFMEPVIKTLIPPGLGHDPLYAVWASSRAVVTIG
jgi:SAM-dependent methyltransferase